LNFLAPTSFDAVDLDKNAIADGAAAIPWWLMATW
jgi:hypothetical protein